MENAKMKILELRKAKQEAIIERAKRAILRIESQMNEILILGKVAPTPARVKKEVAKYSRVTEVAPASVEVAQSEKIEKKQTKSFLNSIFNDED